jgi:hypothetical protein
MYETTVIHRVIRDYDERQMHSAQELFSSKLSTVHLYGKTNGNSVLAVASTDLTNRAPNFRKNHVGKTDLNPLQGTFSSQCDLARSK